MKKFLASLSLLCVLASCSLTAPRDVGKANMFTLESPEGVHAGRTLAGVLKIDYPSVPSDLDTYRIAVQTADGRQDYFAGARWNEFLPSVVQAALQDTLAKGQVFTYVETDEGNVANQYVLHTEVAECRAVYETAKAPPLVKIRMVFRLSLPASQKAILRFAVEKTAKAEGNSLLAIAKAFNVAFEAVAKDAVHKLSKAKVK